MCFERESLMISRSIDISDPKQPIEIGTFAIDGDPRAVSISGSIAYVVTKFSDDLYMIDISDPTNPTLLTELDLTRDATDIYVSGRYAYIVGFSSAGMSIIDVTGGAYTSLMANSMEVGHLQIRNHLTMEGQLNAAGGLNVGKGGVFSAGDIGVDGSLVLTDKLGINVLQPEMTLHIGGQGNASRLLLSNGGDIFFKKRNR